jgi:3-deoxy-D-manno-octulosonic-acid transferase
MEVVNKYDTERLQWVTRLDSIEKEVKDTEALIKDGLGEMRSHYAKISAVIGKEV